MKKFVIVLLAFVLALSLVSCDKDKKDDETTVAGETTAETTAAETTVAA